jgi:Copper binding proteins, plastocyanin/azurin family
MRSLPPVLVAAAAIVTACGGGGSATNAGASPGPVQHPSSLAGVVGHNDAFTIQLTDGHGQAIRNLAAGTYTMALDDESSIHNFHVTGAGVDDLTSVGGTGARTFTVTFKPGSYSFFCDPHKSQMHGSFVVSP